MMISISFSHYFYGDFCNDKMEQLKLAYLLDIFCGIICVLYSMKRTSKQASQSKLLCLCNFQQDEGKGECPGRRETFPRKLLLVSCHFGNTSSNITTKERRHEWFAIPRSLYTVKLLHDMPSVYDWKIAMEAVVLHTH